MTIQLYDLCGADTDLRFSPQCWKASLALAHKGLPTETIPLPFTAIRAIGGGGVTKTVPVIDDQGRLIRDSFAIAEYLDANYPQRPLFGGDGPVLARYVEANIHTAVHPVITAMMVKDIHDVLAPADQAYFRQSREKRSGRSLEEMQVGVDALADDLATAYVPVRRALAHGPWLGGNSPMFVDYVAAGALIWLRTITGGVPLTDDNPVKDWFERILDLFDGLARNAKTARSGQ